MRSPVRIRPSAPQKSPEIIEVSGFSSFWRLCRFPKSIEQSIERACFSDQIADCLPPDEWAAFEWMYSKQLGRRNLTETQRTYMLGMMHVARLKSVGNTTNARNADGTFVRGIQLHQSDPIGDKPKSTAEVIAREQNVSEPTVKRASKFARGLNGPRSLLTEETPRD